MSPPKSTTPAPRGRKLPEFLTAEERRALLRQPNLRAPTGLRNACLLRVMVNAGLRASEALSVRLRDVNWTTGRLTVRQGKGRKDRVLWLAEEDLAMLGRWRERREALELSDKGPTRLFTTLGGGPILDRYLRAMVARVAAKAGIEKRVHPHTLRHTFATDLYRETKNIRLVQKALGHSDLSTTMIYTHVVDDELEDALKNFRRSDP